MSFTTLQAVAAVDRKASRNAPACAALPGPAPEPADAAGGLGYHEGQPMGRPAPGIAPYRGWTLWHARFGGSARNAVDCYSAEKQGRFTYLSVHRRFEMSQARWEWLVDHGFPGRPSPRGGTGNWSACDIDAEIAREVAA